MLLSLSFSFVIAVVVFCLFGALLLDDAVGKKTTTNHKANLKQLAMSERAMIRRQVVVV